MEYWNFSYFSKFDRIKKRREESNTVGIGVIASERLEGKNSKLLQCRLTHLCYGINYTLDTVTSHG